MASRVLVTGGTGFIGAHIVDKLVARGHKVRITTRSAAKAHAVQEKYTEGQVDFVVVADFETGHADFGPAVKGCTAIIHTASPLKYDVVDVEKELIRPAIEGVEAVLRAAAAEPTVKRVVLTSSYAAVMDSFTEQDRQQPNPVYTGKHWNPLSYADSCKANPIIAYRGAKKFAEKAAWDFVDDPANNAQFDLVTLCPPMTFGPILHPVADVHHLNLSNANLWSIAEGARELPAARVPFWIDVRDLAEAHVRALEVAAVGGHRYVPASPQLFSYELAAHIMRAHFEWAPARVLQPSDEPPTSDHSLDGAAVTRDLGVSYHTFEQTVVDAIGQFYAMAAK